MNCKCGGEIRPLKDSRLVCTRCLRVVPEEGDDESGFRRAAFWICQVAMMVITGVSIALAARVDGRFALLLFTLLIPAWVTGWAVVNPRTGRAYNWVPPAPPGT